MQPHLEPELIPLMTSDEFPFADRIRNYLDTGAHVVTSNVRDQLRRAVGAPLAGRNLSSSEPVAASGVPARDGRCIA